MKFITSIWLILFSLSIFAQGKFPPAAGEKGTTAIHKDSSVFKSWANSCRVIRGKQDFANPQSDTTSIGTSSNALGKADGTAVISLGDGGEATLTFAGEIFDGPGPDFAVFENGFSATFLELAFVEVSSDGVNFFRFPSESLTDTTKEIGPFSSLHAYQLHNLAGKYQANYGTPFDLDDLKDEPGLDVQKITHVRLIDVIGTIDSVHASRDSKGRKINDPYPTAFPSGGFDLDAVGVIHSSVTGIEEYQANTIAVYPNPCINELRIDGDWSEAEFEIVDIKGHMIERGRLINNAIDVRNLVKGIYFIHIVDRKRTAQAKFFKR